MIKSWISFLLPNDEYKRQKIVYFYAEAAGISILTFVVLFLVNRLSSVNFDVEVVLGLAIVVPLAYVVIRYILSGIEYSDVATAKQFKKQKRIFFMQTISFVVIFLILYTLFVGVPKAIEQWKEMIGLLILTGVAMFLVNYISLKRSYKKNKELSDDE